MATRYFHFLVVLAVLGAVLGVERSAWAGAPYCDPEAFTGNASAPVLGVADMRFEEDEAMSWGGCEKLASLLQGTEPPNEHPNAAESYGTGRAITVEWAEAFNPSVSRTFSTRVEQTRGPNGYPPGVFRPPRPHRCFTRRTANASNA